MRRKIRRTWPAALKEEFSGWGWDVTPLITDRIIPELLAILDKREESVLRLVFGIDESSKTLEEIGVIIGRIKCPGKVRGQQVQRIRNRALRKIHSHLALK